MFSLLLLSVLGSAVASPVDIANVHEVLVVKDARLRNSLLESVVLGLLEELRGTMLTGNNDIPVLDPFEVANVHVDDSIIPIPGAYITLNDLKVNKLSTFVVDRLSISTASIIPQRYRLEFDAYVPVLEVDSSGYDLSVSVAGVNIFGNGDAKINLIEPRVTGTLVLSPRFTIGSGLYLTIVTSEVKFNLKAFDSVINGLLGDDSMTAFINTFLKNFVPEAIELYEPEITQILSTTVLDIGNDLLANLNLGGILGL